MTAEAGGTWEVLLNTVRQLDEVADPRTQRMTIYLGDLLLGEPRPDLAERAEVACIVGRAAAWVHVESLQLLAGRLIDPVLQEVYASPGTVGEAWVRELGFLRAALDDVEYG